MARTVYLVDASLYIYRSYHAIRNLSMSSGQPTNAVLGFVSTISKLIREKKPEYMALAFDSKGPTFRHEIYPDYKANRPPMPEDLISQQEYIRRAVAGFNLARLEIQGIEADDIIASAARQARKQGFEVVIVGGDKDLFQLLAEGVSIYDPKPKGDNYVTEESFRERFGISPSGFLEAQGLMGDATDNYSGVPGVGEKTALKLIQEFETLENIFENLERVKQKNLRRKLEEHKESAFLARRLAHLKTDTELDLNFEELKVAGPDIEALRSLYRELELNRLLSNLESLKTISYEDYHLVDTDEKLAELVSELDGVKKLSIDLETTSTDPMRAEIVGFSFSARPHRAFYVPVAHQDPAAPQLPLKKALETFKPILESKKVVKAGQNIKYDYIILRRNGLTMSPLGDDSMLASYLLDPSNRVHSLERISAAYLSHDPITYDQVVGDKKAGFDSISPEAAKEYACEDADLALMLAETLRPKLAERGLLKLYEEMELPLIEVLAEMEMNGVKLDLDQLQKLSVELAGRALTAEAKIYDLAGKEFNINSPKQLGEVLFEDLGLPQGKKTRKKTGYSTDVAVMTELAEIHPLPNEVLTYRSLVKLRSTYLESLPKLIHPETGRVHTSYNQTGTATGRLSSSNPNLQNIPIRTEEGRRIRAGFVPEEGDLILSADYSQIELRILAHFSEAEGLLSAFSSGQDIHTRTASEIFNVFPDMVDSRMRREAKAINFGIIYGMGAFRLAKELGIERKKAQEYIDEYFNRYEGVKTYLEKTVEQARSLGYVTTLYNRRRYIPELKSGNRNVRANAERMAVNTPLQGSAADIIKMAMLDVHRALKKEKFPAKMIMQVHDELVFEVNKDYADQLTDLVREKMEGVISLKVPLKVDVSYGPSWAEAH